MGKLLFRLGFLLITPLVVAVLLFSYLRSHLLQPVNPDNKHIINVDLPENVSINELAQILFDKQLIKAPWVVKVLTKVNSDIAKIIHGEYELMATMTPREVLDKLRSGDVVKRRISIQPGDSMMDIANAFEAAGIRDQASVMTAFVDPELIIRAGISNSNFEGYLSPGEYQFSKTEPLPRIIWKMLESGENAWLPEYADRAEELKLTRHEVLTLASLIQAETDTADYQAAVSGVFHNRLMNLMRLESEPSARYGSSNVDEPLRETELADQANPYNTFVHYGLPPGPICNPGDSAVNAALNYQSHQFLFFLKDGSGGFMFAETLNDYVAIKQKLDKK